MGGTFTQLRFQRRPLVVGGCTRNVPLVYAGLGLADGANLHCEEPELLTAHRSGGHEQATRARAVAPFGSKPVSFGEVAEPQGVAQRAGQADQLPTLDRPAATAPPPAHVRPLRGLNIG